MLKDEIELEPGGLRSFRALLVYASSKHDADIVARIHHSIILKDLGLL